MKLKSAIYFFFILLYITPYIVCGTNSTISSISSITNISSSQSQFTNQILPLSTQSQPLTTPYSTSKNSIPLFTTQSPSSVTDYSNTTHHPTQSPPTTQSISNSTQNLASTTQSLHNTTHFQPTTHYPTQFPNTTQNLPSTTESLPLTTQDLPSTTQSLQNTTQIQLITQYPSQSSPNTTQFQPTTHYPSQSPNTTQSPSSSPSTTPYQPSTQPSSPSTFYPSSTTQDPTQSPDDGASVDEFCNKKRGKQLKIVEETYSMKNDTQKIYSVPHRSIIAVNISEVNIYELTDYLIVQAHSQNKYIILTQSTDPLKDDAYVNATDPGLVIESGFIFTARVYLVNCHKINITVLFMVRNYTFDDPIPGLYKSRKVPEPFLYSVPNILTTKVSYRAAVMKNTRNDSQEELTYETFLTYMYERDLSETKYWDTLIAMSTLEGVHRNGKSVALRSNNNTAEQLSDWFVSYSGVGAVITVVVSFNKSAGTLYSSTVSYGCDFIDAEEYTCTKLVNPLAKLFCASLIFIGFILLFLGHRWLNFTMFISGFLFSWCIFFLLFAQASSRSITALGWGTLFGGLCGGIAWLFIWHRFKRPFHSALIIIILSVVFVGMTATFFLRYAISPKSNMAVFVVFPAFFAIIIIAYAIINIKKVHIFSCAMLGSYAVIVPLAFYLGSSLTYIVINVIALLTVEHYSHTLGYPPFQVCDIILLCLWIFLFGVGFGYQLFRERSSPPFHPPNLVYWYNTKRATNFILDKVLACLPLDPDPGGAGIEERPVWLLRVTYTFKLLKVRLHCAPPDTSEFDYQSFQNLRRSQSLENLDSGPSYWTTLKIRVLEFIERVRFRLGIERREEEEEEEEDVERLLSDEA